MSKNNIEEALDLVPLNENGGEILVPEETTKDADATYVRENMYEIIDTGKDALSEMAEIAQASQDPRAYRVLTELISAMVHANKEMMEIKKISKEIESPNKKVEQNLFVGSTSQMLELLKAKRNENGNET